ncbi:O-antigen ligase family protein [Patescibacteria group bacterium]|nr:O-antigen ligase family protein [Patescibacteria group bacterium]
MNLESFLRTQLKIGVVLVLFTPLLVGPFGISFSEYPKALFLRVMIEILFFLYLLLLLKNPGNLPRCTPLLGVLAVFGVIQLAAGAAGFNFFRSFFGDFFWPQGTMLFLHLLALFLILSSVFRERAEWMLLFRTAAFVGLISAGAAFLQKFEVFHFWGLYLEKGVSGTLSNPVFFGSYLAVALFLTLFVFSMEQRFFMKGVWAVTALLETAALWESGSRGAWAGALTALLAFVFFVLYKRLFSSLGTARAFAALAIMAVLVLGAASPFLSGAFSSLEEKRLPFWGVALEAWTERPFLGWGPESFGYVADKRIGLASPSQTFSNHPHNVFLEQLAETGIIGFAAFLVLLLLVAVRLSRNAFSPWLSATQRALLGAVFIACLACEFFFAESISTALLFILLLGFIGTQSAPFVFRARAFLVRGGAVALIVLLAVVLWEVNLKPWKANMLVVQGSQLEQENLTEALLLYDKALHQDTLFDDDFKILLAERLLSFYGAPGTEQNRFQMLGLLSEAEPALERKLGYPDKMHRHYFDLLAGIQEIRYTEFGSRKAAEKMEEISERALQEYPGRDDERFFRILMKAHIYQGEYEEAEYAFESIISYYEKRLLALNIVEQNQEERERLAVHFSLAIIENEQKIGRMYWTLGERERAAKHFTRILELDAAATPDFSRLYVSSPQLMSREAKFTGEVIEFYRKDLQDETTAQELLQRALEIYPVELHSLLRGETP